MKWNWNSQWKSHFQWNGLVNGKQTPIGTEANGNETINGIQTANEIGTGILNGTVNEINVFHFV